MSDSTDPKARAPAAERGEDDKEGWESLAEESSDGALAPNRELEEALREAVESIEAHRDAKTPPGAPAQQPEAAPAGPGAGEAAAEETAALRDRLLRLQADFENFRKRTLRERQEAHLFGHENLVKDLLPTVDNLERAIDHARKSGGGGLEGFLEGVELVLRELQAALAKHGVEVIEAADQPFDPAVHEAMAQAPSEEVPPNTVIEVFQKGYRLRDRLLRPARVVVSGPPEEGGESGE